MKTLKLASLCLIVAWAASAGPADTVSRDWGILQGSDTLDIRIQGRKVGTAVHVMEVTDSGRAITRYTGIRITPPSNMTGLGKLHVEETRMYGSDGVLRRANQTLSSPSGVSGWTLEPGKKGSWNLTVVTGGVDQTREVKVAAENLNVSYAITNGIEQETIEPGNQWRDTVFELSSGQSVPVSIECTRVSPDSGLYWFAVNNELTNRLETLALDTAGRIFYEEIPPFFTAHRLAGPGGKKRPDADSASQKIDFMDLSRIPVSRRANPKERILLELQRPARLHPSVQRFYLEHQRGWMLRSPESSCSGAERDSLSPKHRKTFTASTPTMQCDHLEITELAESVRGTDKITCNLAAKLNTYVYESIDKVGSTTFSSALETLHAGYGDCGEHAVLLGALYRALNMPARVVLGLVYQSSKKAYYYHAWVLVYVEGKWIFADPSHGKFPAYRDRIPLVVDDTGSDAVGLSRYIGRIKVSNISYGSRGDGE